MPLNSHLPKHSRFALLVLALIASLILPGCTTLAVVGTAAVATAVVTDRRDTGSLLEDQALTIRITDTIYADQQLGKTVNINVVSFNGVVLLTGDAPSPELRARAASIANKLSGVRMLYNEVKVGPRRGLDDAGTDAWLTTRVKAELVKKRGPVTHTKVVTAHGIVYLLGMASQWESQQATSIARGTRGVNDVIPLFEQTEVAEADSKRFTPRNTAAAPNQQGITSPEKLQELREDQDTAVIPFTLTPAVEMDSE